MGSEEPHPFPITMKFITDAIKQLRAVGANEHAHSHRAYHVDRSADGDSDRGSDRDATDGPGTGAGPAPPLSPPTASRSSHLWRGLMDVAVDSRFHDLGGTELAPMSTTVSLDVAVRYAIGGVSSVLLHLETSTFMQRGASLSYLSAFPDEVEHLYPPLTFLQPIGMQRVDLEGGSTVDVLTVVPYLGS